MGSNRKYLLFYQNISEIFKSLVPFIPKSSLQNPSKVDFPFAWVMSFFVILMCTEALANSQVAEKSKKLLVPSELPSIYSYRPNATTPKAHMNSEVLSDNSKGLPNSSAVYLIKKASLYPPEVNKRRVEKVPKLDRRSEEKFSRQENFKTKTSLHNSMERVKPQKSSGVRAKKKVSKANRVLKNNIAPQEWNWFDKPLKIEKINGRFKMITLNGSIENLNNPNMIFRKPTKKMVQKIVSTKNFSKPEIFILFQKSLKKLKSEHQKVVVTPPNFASSQSASETKKPPRCLKFLRKLISRIENFEKNKIEIHPEIPQQKNNEKETKEKIIDDKLPIDIRNQQVEATPMFHFFVNQKANFSPESKG